MIDIAIILPFLCSSRSDPIVRFMHTTQISGIVLCAFAYAGTVPRSGFCVVTTTMSNRRIRKWFDDCDNATVVYRSLEFSHLTFGKG